MLIPKPVLFPHLKSLFQTITTRPTTSKYQAIESSSVALGAQTCNSIACLTQSPSNGPWILHSGASNHISGNKIYCLFNSISFQWPRLMAPGSYFLEPPIIREPPIMTKALVWLNPTHYSSYLCPFLS